MSFSQDWTAKSRSSVVSSTTVIPSYRLARSNSAEAVNASQSRTPPTFDFAVPQYPRSSDTNTRSNLSTFYLAPPSANSKALSANSSPSAANFPQTPQQQISPSQSSLSIESVPTSMLDDPYPYRYNTYPAMRGHFPNYSPGSNASADVSALYNVERRHISNIPTSVVSAPPSRTSFQNIQQQQRNWSPLPNGPQKEVALRRFRSATPTIGGALIPSPPSNAGLVPRSVTTPDNVPHLQLRRTSSPSHLGLYISSQTEEPAIPVTGAFYGSPANALSQSSLHGSEGPNHASTSPAPLFGTSSIEEPRGHRSPPSPAPQMTAHAYSMPVYADGSVRPMHSGVVVNSLVGADIHNTSSTPNSNFANLSDSVPTTNMMPTYRSAPVGYNYTPSYSSYPSYAV